MDPEISEKSNVGALATSKELIPRDIEQRGKSCSIQGACERGDFQTLVELATSTGGLLTDELRGQACMSPYSLA